MKDPKKSLQFYQDHLGLTLIDKYKFEKYDFSLYFLASLKPGETYDLTPGTKEAHAYLWDCDRVTLELTVSLLLSSLLLYSDLALLRSLSHSQGARLASP